VCGINNGHRQICDLISHGSYDKAVDLASTMGMGIGEYLYAKGETSIHEICRCQDKAALYFLEDYCKDYLSESQEPIPTNNLCLTRFDYMTHKISFS